MRPATDENIIAEATRRYNVNGPDVVEVMVIPEASNLVSDSISDDLVTYRYAVRVRDHTGNIQPKIIRRPAISLDDQRKLYV